MKNNLPNNWVETNIKTISNILRGVSYKKDEAYLEPFDSSIYILRGGNIQDEKIDLKTNDNVYVSKNLIQQSQLIKKNDVVIVGSTGSKKLIGKAGVADADLPKVSFGAFLMLLRTDVIDKKFHSYFFQTLYYRNSISNLAGGVNINNIKKEHLENLIFPLPPLPEQERIVAKLDALFTQHEAMKKALERIPQLLKNFRQQVLDQAISGKMTERWRDSKNLNSYLAEIKKSREKLYLKKVDESLRNGNKKPKKLITDIFNYFEFDKSIELPDYWQIDNLKNICDLITDGEHSTPKRTDEGYFLLSARNVRDGFISFDNVDYVCESEFNRLYQRCNPEHNDILISCSGSVGRVSVFPEGKKAVMVRSAALLKLQSNKNISKFIEFVLRSNLGQKQIKKLTKSTAQANLFLEPIGKIVIPIPSFEEIEKIINKIESLFSKADAIEKRYQTLKEKIDSLPQAILHKAFKGELVPQLPTDGDAKDLLEEILKLKKEVKKK